MEKRFIVSIIEIGQETKTIGKEWKIVEQDENNRGKYGYTPEALAKRDYQREVYRQELNECDIPAVVATVNGLPSSEKI